MAIPRLNGIIRALESGKNATVCFQPGDTASAQAVSTEKYDGVVFEMEHGAYDIKALRDCLQYMLNRQQIAASGSVAPAVTPMVRIPPNGAEMNQWVAKQVLDQGVYGVLWPHISTVEEARNAVASCRYARPAGAPRPMAPAHVIYRGPADCRGSGADARVAESVGFWRHPHPYPHIVKIGVFPKRSASLFALRWTVSPPERRAPGWARGWAGIWKSG